MKTFTCDTCGKAWPEAYCPECSHSIGQRPLRQECVDIPAWPGGPPLIPTPGLAPQPPPLPPLRPPALPVATATSPRKPLFPWGRVLLVALPILVAFCYFGFQFYQLYDYPLGYRNRPSSGVMRRPGEAEFAVANGQIDSFISTNAFGNTPDAAVLAHQFAEMLQEARARLFTPGSRMELFDSTKQNFIAYCELHDEECAFLVHVPGLRKFDRGLTQRVDARTLLAQTAWLAAQTVLKASRAGKPKMEMAVGLRGISQYGPIMIGYYSEAAAKREDGLIKYLDEGAETHFLWPFFNRAPEAKSPAVEK